MKPRLVFAGLLLTPFLGGCAPGGGDERPLGQRLVETLPTASEGEFPDPQSAARAFAEALVDDDWDGVLRASTLRLRCERVSFETEAQHVAAVIPSSSGDPAAPLAQFSRNFRVIDDWRRLQLLLAGVDEPDRVRRLERDDSGAFDESIAAAKRESIYARPEGLRVAGSRRDADLSAKTWEQFSDDAPLEELGAADAAWVKVTLEGVPGLDEVVIDCVLLEIGSNWLVDLAMLE